MLVKLKQQTEIIKVIETALSGYPEIHTIILFGSAIKDRLRADSDIDIAVAAERSLSVEQFRKLAASLNGSLSHPVDLIDLKAVSGPILKEALCTGEVIRKSSVIQFAQLIKKMLYNQSDMMPNSLIMLSRHCERFING